MTSCKTCREDPKAKKRVIAIRNKWRSTVCSGCRHNYYNFQKGGSERGDVAVSADMHCWNMPHKIDRRRKDANECPHHSKGYYSWNRR